MKKENGNTLKVPRIALVGAAFFGLTLGACRSSDGNSGDTIPPNDPLPGEDLPPELDPTEENLLELPFPPNKDMRIQQAWIGFDPSHSAMDIIKGTLDTSSTWESFPVLAGADGKACANPSSRQGNAVLIEHDFDGRTIFEYSGHLKSITEGIPDCGNGEKNVKQGEAIGIAGSTGVAEDGKDKPSWIHIHWRIFDEKNISIDPFDVESAREDYPNINEPRYTNGNLCGKDTILVGCPTENDQPMIPTPRGNTPTPLATRSIQTQIPTDTHTPKPTLIVESPIPSSPIQTPESTENAWTTFTSAEHNYQTEYRSNWWTNSGLFSIGSSDTIEYFNGNNINNHSVDIGIVSQNSGDSFDVNEYIDYVLGRENGFIINSYTQMPNEPGLNQLAQIKIDGVSVTAIYIDGPSYNKNRIIFERNNKIWNIILTYGKDYSDEDIEYIRDKTLIHMLESLEFLD